VPAAPVRTRVKLGLAEFAFEAWLAFANGVVEAVRARDALAAVEAVMLARVLGAVQADPECLAVADALVVVALAVAAAGLLVCGGT
jgi:hypothetical protein